MNLKPRDTKKDSFEEEIKKGSSKRWIPSEWIDSVGKLTIAISVIVVIFYFSDDASHNPSNSICIQWEDYNGNILNGTDVTIVALNNLSDYTSEVVKEYPYEIQVENFYIHNTIAKCKEWNQKTKCELNATDGDCICEEWQTKQIPGEMKDKTACVPLGNLGDKSLSNVVIEINGTTTTEPTINSATHFLKDGGVILCLDFPAEYNSITIGNTTLTHNTTYTEFIPSQEEKTCIKAREKNECERGEKDWIWADTAIILTEPIGGKNVYNATITMNETILGCIASVPNSDLTGCIPDKFCRRKMLDDYTCADLFGFIVSDKYIPISAETNLSGCNQFCRSYTDDEMTKVFTDRGCI